MTSLRRLPHVLAAGTLIAGLVSACGSSSHPPKTIVQQKSRASEKGETLWAASITGGAGVPAGRWRLHLEPQTKQVFLTAPGSKPYSTGQLLTQSRIKFGALATCKNQGKASTGTYSYHETSSQLTLTKQSDSCTARAKILTGQTWTRAQ
jgi:hypothetical protein